MAEQYAAAPAADEDPLELEHMMGFAGDKQGSVTFHPREPNKMISYTGCLLVISDVDDPHKQEFLRGHNEAITCLAVSPSGNLLATGQASTTRVPNSEATVIVWDWQTRQPIYRLMELHDGIQFSRNCVRQLAFSADEAFLAGSDDQPGGAKLCIWQTSTAQLAVFQKTAAREMAFLEWGAIVESTRKINKQPSYKLHAADKEKVLTYSIDFDNRTMQYKMTSEIMQLPSSGLTRGYNCGHAFGSFLIAGSSAGELCVFNTVTQVFRACVPVSKGGLLCLCTGPAPDPDAPPLAYCGCGDGTLKVLQGADLQWVCLAEVTLDGNLMSVTLSADGVEVLVGTSTGNIYRLDAASLTNLGPDGQPSKLPLLASHSKPIRCMGFGESSEWFVTASDSGALRRWELSHYSVDYEIAPPVKTTDATALVRADCLAVRKGSILTGWSDGVIRSYDERDGGFLWEIVSAHRGGVSCIDLTPLYLVSAGQDGSVRVWGESESRSLLGNFDEHSKRVTGLCVDVANPALIHTCAEDKLVVTIDLNQARRTSCHSVKEGIFKSMCQATTGELELVSADTAGNLKWWDCDEVDPVSMMVTWSPHDDAHKERRLTHLEMSPPLAEGTVGSDYLLATTASGDVQVWDLGESTLVSVGTAHSDEVTMARWAPDGKQVVSCGKDACICVWNFYGTAKPPGSIRLPSQQQ